MNINRRIDKTEEVFSKEFAKLQEYRSILDTASVSPENLLIAFTDIVKEYESLLTDAVKITRIGDVSQHKLLKAKEKIEDLNAKLVESERNVRELNTILMFYIKATDK